MLVSEKIKRFFSSRPFIGIRDTIRNEENHMKNVFSIISVYILYWMTFTGGRNIAVTFQKSPPLCWSPDLVGFAAA